MPLRLLALLFTLGGTLAAIATPASDAEAFDRFARLFPGAFSSAEQALGDKNFRHVVVHCVRIWPERTDGSWFYLEHAAAEGLDQPYRQRVHQLIAADDGSLELRVFTVDDPIKATGAWRHENPLADLSRERLTFQEGCSLFFRAMPDGTFVGATRGDGCVNHLRGATRAIAEMTLAAGKLTFWERGLNAKGRQVWGTTNGGYVFKRVAAP